MCGGCWFLGICRSTERSVTAGDDRPVSWNAGIRAVTPEREVSGWRVGSSDMVGCGGGRVERGWMKAVVDRGG